MRELLGKLAAMREMSTMASDEEADRLCVEKKSAMDNAVRNWVAQSLLVGVDWDEMPARHIGPRPHRKRKQSLQKEEAFGGS